MEVLRKITGKTLIEGHRGAKDLGAENSWDAILKGYEAGADILEIDVQISKDKKLLLSNDYLLPNGQWIKDLNSPEIRKLIVKEHKIVFLHEVLEWVIDKSIYLTLDIKNGYGLDREIFHKTLNLVEDLALTEKVMFLAWDHEGLLEIKKKTPEATTRGIIRGLPINLISSAQEANLDAISLSRDLTTLEIVKAFQKQNIAVFIEMTFRSDFKLVENWEVDGISCSDPGKAKREI